MIQRLLLCTDLDRTLIPNGPQPESPGARAHFSSLVSRAEVTLAYVTGRHRTLVEEAMRAYELPVPDFVVGDVGTTIYEVGSGQLWKRLVDWEREIAADWNGHSHLDLLGLLDDLPELRPQEPDKQNDYKLSYYACFGCDRGALSTTIRDRLDKANVRVNLVWSVDDLEQVELLDVLPERASKQHAIDALIALLGFRHDESIFCGDSGNDIEVLSGPVPAVLVANCRPEVRELAERLVRERDLVDRLYVARGDFMGMNGNYSAGILEGVAHYHATSVGWMDFGQAGEGE